MKKLYSFLVLIFVFATLSISAQKFIYTPALSAPSDADTNQVPNVVLDWDAVTGGSSDITYEVHLDVDSTFSNPVIFTTMNTSVTCEELMFGTQYFWKVRASDGTNTSYWSEIWDFTIFDGIVLWKPNDGHNDDDPDVLLTWRDKTGGLSGPEITGLTYFDIQLDTAVTFDSPMFISYVVDGDVFEKNAEYLHFGTTYNWRVRAGHSLDETEWSDLRTFTTIVAVELDDPNNGSTDMGIVFELEWDKISGILDYIIQIDTDPAFSDPIERISLTNKIMTEELIFGNMYYWRVNANHINDVSEWSEVWTFETINTVLLDSPENGAINVERLPNLEWEEILGASKFQVQYNDSPDFTEPISDVITPDSLPEFQIIYILEKEVEYFWRVRAMDGLIADTTDWSEVWSFTTIGEIGIDNPVFNEANISIFPNPSNGNIFLNIETENSMNVKLSIMDLLGKSFYEKQFQFNHGTNSQKIVLDDLANGIYIVRLENDGKVYTEKLVIDK
ncbi:MAG: T9SS type A sorting domain-containing protein [Bacteroidales bacterium]|nr:T9SS type A sorting domain-containing protein [Bacteroidales bacterium]